MPIVNAKELLMKATKEKYAVGAFNITNLILMEAVVEAAVDRKAPLIIQTSVTPAKFLGARVLVAIFRELAQAAPIPICLHLDHCTDVEFCKQCTDAGYTNIMIDASQQTFEENIRQTRAVVDYAHAKGAVSVEGELGTVSGVEDQVKVVENEAALCNPAQVVEYTQKSGVDTFAPAIGTAHGVYKTPDPKIDFDRFERISLLLNGRGVKVPLVVHGGTGLPPATVKRLVALGGAKFNVSTELKYTLIDSVYEYITNHRDEYDPGRIDKAVKASVKEKIYHWIDLLGCAGKAA